MSARNTVLELLIKYGIRKVIMNMYGKENDKALALLNDEEFTAIEPILRNELTFHLSRLIGENYMLKTQKVEDLLSDIGVINKLLRTNKWDSNYANELKDDRILYLAGLIDAHIAKTAYEYHKPNEHYLDIVGITDLIESIIKNNNSEILKGYGRTGEGRKLARIIDEFGDVLINESKQYFIRKANIASCIEQEKRAEKAESELQEIKDILKSEMVSWKISEEELVMNVVYTNEGFQRLIKLTE